MSVDTDKLDFLLEEQLAASEAAQQCGIRIETLRALQKVGVFSTTNVPRSQLQRTLTELFAKGLPWPTPTRKSQWRPFPFVQAVWTKTEGGMRLHARWRHYPEAKSIRHPFGSGPWVETWFASERSYAQRYGAVSRPGNQSPIAAQSGANTNLTTPKLVTRDEASLTKQKAPPILLSPPIFLTPEELCERWRGRVAIETLSNWRAAENSSGPAFLKIGRAILYPVEEVMAFEEQHLFPRFKS